MGSIKAIFSAITSFENKCNKDYSTLIGITNDILLEIQEYLLEVKKELESIKIQINQLNLIRNEVNKKMNYYWNMMQEAKEEMDAAQADINYLFSHPTIYTSVDEDGNEHTERIYDYSAISCAERKRDEASQKYHYYGEKFRYANSIFREIEGVLSSFEMTEQGISCAKDIIEGCEFEVKKEKHSIEDESNYNIHSLVNVIESLKSYLNSKPFDLPSGALLINFASASNGQFASISLNQEDNTLLSEKYYDKYGRLIDISDEEYDLLDNITQAKYDLEYAYRDAADFIIWKNQGNDNPATEQALSEGIDCAIEKYQDLIKNNVDISNNSFEKELSSKTITTINSIVGSLIGMDPVTKMNTTENVKVLADMYGEKFFTSVAEAMDRLSPNNLNKLGPLVKVQTKDGEIKIPLSIYNPDDFRSVEEIKHEDNEIHKRNTAYDAIDTGTKMPEEIVNSKIGQCKLPSEFSKDGERVGKWEGEKGNSTFIPVDERIEILKKYGETGVTYKNNQPDFTKFAFDKDSIVKVENYVMDRADNFKDFDQAYADKKGIAKSEATKIRKENELTWHEIDADGNAILVPQEINGNFAHSGAIAEYNRLKVKEAKEMVDYVKIIKELRKNKSINNDFIEDK